MEVLEEEVGRMTRVRRKDAKDLKQKGRGR